MTQQRPSKSLESYLNMMGGRVPPWLREKQVDVLRSLTVAHPLYSLHAKSAMAVSSRIQGLQKNRDGPLVSAVCGTCSCDLSDCLAIFQDLSSFAVSL